MKSFVAVAFTITLSAQLYADTLRGCVNRSSGNLRIVESGESCRIGERSISMSEVGHIFSNGLIIVQHPCGSTCYQYSPVQSEAWLGQTAFSSISGEYAEYGTLMPNKSCTAGDLVVSVVRNGFVQRGPVTQCPS